MIWIERLIRLALGLTFAVAGALKIPDPQAFAESIDRFQLVPWPAAVAMSDLLPWLELISGGCLIFGWWKQGALSWITCLLALFWVALLIAAARGLNVECGCFGRFAGETGTLMPLARDTGLLLAVGALWWLWSRLNKSRHTNS
jgi:putative oxidoreductase